VLNSSIDIDSKPMTVHHYVNLAVAVDVSEQGLMAPVIRNTDGMNLRGMARGIKAVRDGARNKAPMAEDFSGSTFTVNNPGPLGNLRPCGRHRSAQHRGHHHRGRQAAVGGDAIAIHHTCVLGLSYDHRAFDGVVAARFLAYIRDSLQDRDRRLNLPGHFDDTTAPPTSRPAMCGARTGLPRALRRRRKGRRAERGNTE